MTQPQRRNPKQPLPATTFSSERRWCARSNRWRGRVEETGRQRKTHLRSHSQLIKETVNCSKNCRIGKSSAEGCKEYKGSVLQQTWILRGKRFVWKRAVFSTSKRPENEITRCSTFQRRESHLCVRLHTMCSIKGANERMVFFCCGYEEMGGRECTKGENPIHFFFFFNKKKYCTKKIADIKKS